MTKGYIILREAFPDNFDPDSFWVCFSVLCLVAFLMLCIQYNIYFWERRTNGRVRHRKSRKS